MTNNTNIDVETYFKTIIPRLDEIMELIESSKLHPVEAATVAALCAAHISSVTASSMLRRNAMASPIDAAVRERMERYLVEKVRATDVLLDAAFEHYFSHRLVQ